MDELNNIKIKKKTSALLRLKLKSQGKLGENICNTYI